MSEEMTKMFDNTLVALEKAGLEIVRLTQRVRELEDALTMSNMLDCQYCHKWFPTNKMFTVDACSEEHQKLLGENNE